MRKFIKALCFIFCALLISRAVGAKKTVVDARIAKVMDKTMAGALEMYNLDYNVCVSQVDLALMAKLQSDGYLTAPVGVAAVEISPEGKVLYIGSDGNVIGDSSLALGNQQSQNWLSGPPPVDSVESSRVVGPTISELGDITPFFATCVKKTSTFSVDVDTASYSVAESQIKAGQLPESEGVRVEEFLNAFDQGYEPCIAGDFALHVDGAPSPYGGMHLLRLGLKARKPAERKKEKPLKITLVVDSSGSMDGYQRLGMLQRTIPQLMKRLSPQDEVGIVVYSNSARDLLKPCSVKDEGAINSAMKSINANGGTNVEAGLNKGYEMAAKYHSPDATSLVILFSDGVANSGQLDADKLMANIVQYAGEGILLSTIGIGMGEYNDEFLERLASRGNGMYAYMNEDETALAELGKCLSLTSSVVAMNVRMQVEFDPAYVKRYRLIGYDNRDKGEMDFENVNEEAGAVYAETEVAVVYEVEFTDMVKATGKNPLAVLGSATLRYLNPDGEAKEVAKAISRSSIVDTIEKASYHHKLAAIVAEFAEILRESPFAKNRELTPLLEKADDLSAERPGDSQVSNLALLIKSAQSIKFESAKPKDVCLNNIVAGRIALN